MKLTDEQLRGAGKALRSGNGFDCHVQAVADYLEPLFAEEMLKDPNAEERNMMYKPGTACHEDLRLVIAARRARYLAKPDKAVDEVARILRDNWESLTPAKIVAAVRAADKKEAGNV